MARHQRLTQDTGVEVFFAHPAAPGGEQTKIPTDLSAATFPKEPPISSHQLPRRGEQLLTEPPSAAAPHEAFNQLIATTL